MGTIVVGIDGSPGSTEALRWAVDEARFRGSGVRAIMAWEIPFTAMPPEGAWAASIDWEGSRQEARLLLDETLAAVPSDGVEVSKELAEGPAARALIDAAAEADLVVVGSRGRGGFMALLLGSVSTQVAQHAPCPVVIVPTPGSR